MGIHMQMLLIGFKPLTIDMVSSGQRVFCQLTSSPLWKSLQEQIGFTNAGLGGTPPLRMKNPP